MNNLVNVLNCALKKWLILRYVNLTSILKKAPNKKRLLGNRLGEKEWVAETFIRHFTTYFITSVQLDIFFTVNTYMYHF